MHNYKIVAFKEDLTYNYYIVDQDKDNYLIVMIDNINAYNKANKFDKAELWSEWVPKKELVNINGNMKLKKGSLEAKRFMAKIRAKKGKSKKVSGVKKTSKVKKTPTKKHTDINSHNYKISISGVENLIKDRNIYEKMLKAKNWLINEHLKILKQNSLSKETQKNLKDLNIILKRQILSIKKEIKMLNSKITK